MKKKSQLIIGGKTFKKKVTPSVKSNGKPPDVAPSVKSTGKPPDVASDNPKKKLKLHKKSTSLPKIDGQPPDAAPDTPTNGQPTDAAPDAPTTAPNPFDAARLRLSKDLTSAAVKKVLTVVPCRKPSETQDFVRVRPGEEWRLNVGLLEDQFHNREKYIVLNDLVDELGKDVARVCLFTAIGKNDGLFLWPAKLQGADGRSNLWNDSMLAAVEIAESSWIRVQSNGKSYETLKAEADWGPPVWPDLAFMQILEIAFRGHIIETLDHPVVRGLRGLV